MRQRLEGIRLPWGRYQTSAFADDSAYGISSSDGPSFLQVLNDYCAASNARINYDKSVYFPLSTSSTTPAWVTSLGIASHDPTVPLRVLGYGLVLSPDGVQEDWEALYQQCKLVSINILRRNVTLQGRVLLTNSLLTSKLWYKCRLSSPPTITIHNFEKLAWNTIWNNAKGLVPSKAVGRRSKLQGGVGFISVKAQIPALQAQ
jgi:hypothetical protein